METDEAVRLSIRDNGIGIGIGIPEENMGGFFSRLPGPTTAAAMVWACRLSKSGSTACAAIFRYPALPAS